jgi:hypothetical protein
MRSNSTLLLEFDSSMRALQSPSAARPKDIQALSPQDPKTCKMLAKMADVRLAEWMKNPVGSRCSAMR